MPSSSPDALTEAAARQEQQQPAELQSAPPAQRNGRWQPPAPVRTPTGLFAMLNPGAAGSGPLHDLLKSADNSPRLLACCAGTCYALVRFGSLRFASLHECCAVQCKNVADCVTGSDYDMVAWQSP